MTEVVDPLFVIQMGDRRDDLVADMNSDWILTPAQREEQMTIHDKLAKEQAITKAGDIEIDLRK